MSNSPVYISTFAHSSKRGHLILYSFREASFYRFPLHKNQRPVYMASWHKQGSTKGGWRWQLPFSMPINEALSVTRSALCNLECFGQIRKSQQRKQKMLMPAVNELTFSGHIRKLITPCAWATHVEVMAAATYFQVPVYECCVDLPKTKYRLECIAPQYPPSHFRSYRGHVHKGSSCSQPF